MGSWSFASSQRGLAASLLIGIGALGGASSCCSAVWFAVACPTAEQGSRQNGPGGAALATCMLFSAPERIPGRPGRARPGRSPAHSPGARRDFWHSGIAHLQVRSAASRSADPAAAQPTRGRRAPTAGHRQHSDRCIFCLLLASMSATAGHMPCHYATGKAICHALSRTGVGRDCCTLVVVCCHVELAACSGLQWFGAGLN